MLILISFYTHTHPQTQSHNKLFCGVAGNGRYVGGTVRHVIQCIRRIEQGQMAIWINNVRFMEQFRCLFLHNKYITFMLHISRSILCHRTAIRLSVNNDLFKSKLPIHNNNNITLRNIVCSSIFFFRFGQSINHFLFSFKLQGTDCRHGFWLLLNESSLFTCWSFTFCVPCLVLFEIYLAR